MRIHVPGAGLGFMLSACSLFDPELYQDAEHEPLVLDQCLERRVPSITPSAQTRVIDLASFADDWQARNCVGAAADGNDAFFAINLTQDQKLHVHVSALDAQDPVVYIVDSCDERVCQPLHAASRCSSEKEHLSFVAPKDRRYFVGLDSLGRGGGELELVAVVPRCGNSDKEHSESCDDGNQRSGDGCDSSCRIEIPDTDREEAEANDDLTTANLLQVDAEATSFIVRGILQGGCDPDVFAFSVAQATNLTLRVTGQGNQDTALMKDVELELFQGLTSVAIGTVAKSQVELAPYALEVASDEDARVNADTTYQIRLRTSYDAPDAVIAYTLQLELTPDP